MLATTKWSKARKATSGVLSFLLVAALGFFPSRDFAFAENQDNFNQTAIRDATETEEGRADSFLDDHVIPDETIADNEKHPRENRAEKDAALKEETTDNTESVLENKSGSSEPQEPLALGNKNITPLADISQQLNGLTWNMYKVADDSEPDRDKGSTPVSYLDAFSHYESTYVVMKFNITAPSGGELQSGDTLKFPFLQGGGVSVSNTANENLMASDNQTVLGAWRIFNGNIVIVLNDNAAEQTALNNCTITTAKTLHPYNLSGSDEVNTYTIGTVSHSYKVKGLSRAPLSDYLTKNVSATTNQTVRWLIGVGSPLINDLTVTDGNYMQAASSCIFEDEIPASEASTGITNFYITARVPYIMSDTNQEAATASGTMVLEKTVTNPYFAKVMQQASDTDYETFKNRIETFQYGIYEVGDGSYKFIINFGNPHDADYPLKYSDLWGDLKQSILDANKGVSDKEAEIIANSLGDNNCINGNVVLWVFYITTGYNQAFIDTQKTNTGVLNTTIEGSPLVTTKTAQGTLRAGSAVSSPSALQATIAVADKVSGVPLQGVTAKIQHTIDGGVTWVDTAYGNVTTGTDGQATSGTLAPGTYRFVVVDGMDGYDSNSVTHTSSTNEAGGQFTVAGSDATGVVVTVTGEQKVYTVNYDADNGTAIPAKTDVRFGDANLLPSQAPTKPGMIFDKWEVSEGGVAGTPVDGTSTYADLASDDETAEITLKAVYVDKAAVALPQVTIGQTLRGTPPDPETFTFEMTLAAGDASGVALPPSTSTNPVVTGDAGATFDELSFTKAGVYTFEITETQGFTAGLTYDNAVITMTVTVTEDANGFTVSAPVFTQDGQLIDPLFTNIYLAQSVVVEGIAVEKLIAGDTPAEDDLFIFNLVAENDSNPMPTGAVGMTAELQITGSGTNSYGAWTYEEVGTYVYTIHEQNTQNENYSYDSRIYTVTDVVIDEAGVLSYVRTIHDGIREVGSIMFENTYRNSAVFDERSDGAAGDNVTSEQGDAGGQNNAFQQNDASGQGNANERRSANEGGRTREGLLPNTSDFGAPWGILMVVIISAAVFMLRRARKE